MKKRTMFVVLELYSLILLSSNLHLRDIILKKIESVGRFKSLIWGLKSAVSVFGKTNNLWVEGEGMLHALHFTKDAQGNWSFYYKKRFVETDTYKMESQKKKPTFLPKAPETGELVAVGIDTTKPHCVVGVISADGKELVHKLDLQLDHCSLFHDIGVTKKYNILIDFMLTMRPERIMKGGQEKDARIAVIPHYGELDSVKWFNIEPCVTYHLMNTFEDGDEVVVRGCTANAAIIPGPVWGEDEFDWFSRGFNFKNVASNNWNDHKTIEDGMLFTSVREWRLNMETLEVKERDVTGTEYSMDFPIINEDFTGLKHQYGYAQVINSLASSKAGNDFAILLQLTTIQNMFQVPKRAFKSVSGKTKYGGLAKLHFEETEKQSPNNEGNVKMEYHWLPKNNFCTGSAFVAKPEAVEEEDGWIVTFAHDEDSDTSYVLVVDAKNFGSEPIAKVNLPQRVPYGYHGSFFSST
ncbi:hypothetical protein L2E82_41926 [Cichorium intybus]|uniref:Uncharacterized protein n=1 Tax=Cichorium intybus TaxID=13427 RepID=A0ACB8ZKZ9_CICIN|nr:hypothetical protein L2E82_41926 [Cichorium intybus]